jgi:glycosyltransferase involved in cell wall biosynthesis
MSDDRPVLFVTNHAPRFRVPSFRALAEREHVEFALVGGDLRHGGQIGEIEARHVAEREVLALASSGRYRAVVAGLSGRVALPSAYAGARRAGIPFVLWATIWAHPRTAAHALSYLPLRHIYRDADAIATYGPHVSAYVRAKGARGPVVEAPQAVDVDFWSQSVNAPTQEDSFRACFAGRLDGEKGIAVLIKAWRASGLRAPAAALVLVGEGRFRDPPLATGAAPQDIVLLGRKSPEEVRNIHATSSVVVLPSIPTPDFLEPWGLVVNEAFHQGVPVIATDAVGAVAGGLVQHERNGIVVPAGDATALARALRRLHDDPALRRRLGAQAREDIRPYTPNAWATGMARALGFVGVSHSSPSPGGQ